MKKRILLIASQPFYEWRGSPIRLGFDLLALTQLGYEVDFLTLPLGNDRPMEGVRIVRAPNLFFARRIAIGPSPLKLAFDAIMLPMAIGMVLRRRYAVVHGVEDCGLMALLAARIGRARMIFERHSDPAGYRGGRVRNLVMSLYAGIERYVMRHADVVIGTGPGLVEQARAIGRASRACMIPDIPSSLAQATPAGIASIRRQCRRHENDILIGYVGSFAIYQGIDLLFKAIPIVAARTPRARFVIIGGTPGEIAARKTALADAGCESAVTFLGFVEPDKLPDYLAAMDILLSPRIAGRNTPLKLLDYLKAGAAIVATDCEANRLILDDSLARMTPLNPEGLAEGILHLCHDTEHRSTLSRRGAERLEKRHNFPDFKDALRNCYDYLTQES